MCQNVRIERGQRQRENRRPVPERFPRHQENHQRKRRAQKAGRQPHLENQLVPIAVVPRKPVPPVQIRLGFEVAAFQLRHPQSPPQQRRRRQQLYERWVLRVQSVVFAVPHHVTGKHVVAFVERERFAVNHHQRQDHLHADQPRHDSPQQPSGKFWHVLPIPQNSRGHLTSNNPSRAPYFTPPASFFHRASVWPLDAFESSASSTSRKSRKRTSALLILHMYD